MGILEKYLTPENIKNAPLDELFEIIKDKSHNKLTIQKAIFIKEAATILAEIGDIHRFRSSSALVAFAGIDPTTI